MYLNDLFAINTESNSRKLKMLVQPKYNSKYAYKCIPHQDLILWNRVLVDIIRLSLLESSVMVLGVYVFFLQQVFPENPLRFYFHLCSSFVDTSSSCRRLMLYCIVSDVK